MRRIYQATAIAFLIPALYVVWESRNLQFYTSLGPGPGFFPFWLGLGLAALSLIWLAQVSFKPVSAMEPDFIPNRAGIVRIIALVAALVAFFALVDLVGFQLTMLGFLLFTFLALGRTRLVLTITLSLFGSFGLYYIFNELLSVYLPASSIPFLESLGL